MPKKLFLAVTGLVMLACTGESPVAPQSHSTDIDAVEDNRAAHGVVVASATGGADWVLEVFGFTIPQTLGFSAKKFADGSVSGHINYHQIFEGETFKFNATVTCMNVYDGNRVKYGGEVKVSNDPTVPPGTFIWFQGIDGGEGAAADPDYSTGSGFGDETENEAFCDDPAEPNPLFLAPINGNINVRG